MRGSWKALVAVATLAGVVVLTAGPSLAATPYDSMSPFHVYHDSNGNAYQCNDSMRIVSANYLRVDGEPTGKAVGAIQLRKSTRCNGYWAYVKMYKPVDQGGHAHAELQRLYNGKGVSRHDCKDRGGNGHVDPGQTSCYTPMIYAPSTAVTFFGWGYYFGPSGYADGQTATTR